MYMIEDGLHTIRIKNYELDFLKFGSGKKPLIMIPGLSYIMLSGQVARRQKISEKYANDFTCYYPERRSSLNSGYTTREMAQDVYDFTQALNLKNVSVQGFSQGGMIGQWLAIDHPELVKALVLTVTLAKPNATIKETKKWLELLKRKGPKVALKHMQDNSYSDMWLEQHKNDPIILPPKNSRRALDQYEILEEACQTHDAFEQLEKIKCPTLVNGGWCDCVVSGESSVEIARKIHCDLWMFNNLGHGLYEEDPNYHKRVFEWLVLHTK